MPINFTDKSLWNIAGSVGINSCNVATVGEINALLATAGVPVNYGSQQDLGKRIVIADSEFAAGPSWYVKANGTLYGGVFQVVYIDPGATAANLVTGSIAFLKDKTPSTAAADTGAQVYAISSQDQADSANLIAGVCLTPTVTPGNYTIIQVHGKAVMKFTTVTSHAVGIGVIVGATGNGTVDVSTAPSVNNFLGNAVVDPATTLNLYPVQMKTLLGRY